MEKELIKSEVCDILLEEMCVGSILSLSVELID